MSDDLDLEGCGSGCLAAFFDVLPWQFCLVIVIVVVIIALYMYANGMSAPAWW